MDSNADLLGSFVRAHRERLTAEIGFGRRRTPGLRREELAQRAGISATWVAWIEQGRDVKASPQALARLAAALGLNQAERTYLFELAGRRDPALPALAPGDDAPASIAALVATLAVPAYGLDRLWNACAWNPQAAALFAGWLDDGHDRNLLRYLFLSPAARTLLPDWQDRARRNLAEFRADFAKGRGDPRLQQLVDALSAESTFFAEAWHDQSVLAREGGRRLFVVAEGERAFDQHSFAPSERPDCKLVVLVPVVSI
ncbi:helix-turn-helix domain-containing protein [Sphingomonas sp. MMS12-HWE2-04]|uniref:helix-turn-helix domain-containing protein n=1 Tax=Sphingomonas sp. MMS12-HWE2-04 TaxID=3234199 RepID=UPI003850FC81